MWRAQFLLLYSAGVSIPQGQVFLAVFRLLKDVAGGSANALEMDGQPESAQFVEKQVPSVAVLTQAVPDRPP